MTRVFLDANLLIHAFDPDSTADIALKSDAQQFIGNLTGDPATRLFITPLIRYEVLRGISPSKVEDMAKVLDMFTQLSVEAVDGDVAASVFRAERMTLAPDQFAPIRLIHKHSFDLLHVVCAKRASAAFESSDARAKSLFNLVCTRNS